MLNTDALNHYVGGIVILKRDNPPQTKQLSIASFHVSGEVVTIFTGTRQLTQNEAGRVEFIWDVAGALWLFTDRYSSHIIDRGLIEFRNPKHSEVIILAPPER